MTLDFYDLKEEPFGFLPDARFLYLCAAHRQAIATLLHALQAGRGFVTLLAPPDMGKTTLLFQTLNSLGDKVSTVYLFQAPRTPVDLLRAVLTDLGVRKITETAEGMSSQLREVLLEAHHRGKRVIVVIDEAQNLDTSILDLVCTLPNLATIGVKLIQFILCGQPLLADKLAAIRPIQSMEWDDAAAHLEPLSAQDTARYVDHRLRTAGYSRQSPLFTPEAAALVARYSQGTPRAINHLCFEALSTAYRYRRQQIGVETVREAAASLDLHPAPAAPQALQIHSALALPKRAAISAGSRAFQTAKAAALLARSSLLALGPVVSRLLPRVAIAALLLFAFSGAVFEMYRAQAAHPLGKQTMAALPLPKAPTAAPQDPPLPNLKAMDLQSALHALATRKQRQRQNQTLH